ncbi:hypothetical protein MGU_09191 [Metarhizium guizhouense ARSEF 977]|uniref:Hydrophobin n=1 Tax=Metarhizium guizhouense (strain ARSEF 977) TaxID=1276136 RepID=A0A0B4H198_METGA|nr:hypothetical protein MGU_09191 [Metarhizium guizhouense ARSEF 977]
MKFTAAILVLAAAVMAAPYDNPPPNPNHTPAPAPAPGAGAGSCSSNQKTICCDKVIGLFCHIGLVNNCGSEKLYCCNTNTPTTQNGGVNIININAGSCNKLF